MRRRAFTLIEVMIVIGIIILLVGIVAYGLSRVINNSKAANTRVVLNNLRSMVAEFETTSKGLNRQPAYMWATTAGNPLTQWNSTVVPINIWREGDPTDAPTNLPEPDPIFVQGGNITKEAAGSNAPLRYNANAIANTQLVMGLLIQNSINKKASEQWSRSQSMEEIPAAVATSKLTITNTSPPPATMVYSSGAANRAPNPLLPLDAWGNPILFVPAGGLCGDTNPANTNLDSMWIGGPPDSTFARGQKMVVSNVTNPAQQIGPIKSRDSRPFWASAGPDGDFRTGDDNLYSFDN
jgi:type II secretory pathway pseudopilin PulG